MSAILHQARQGAIGQSHPLLSGNTCATRPSRLDPMACDCCGRPAGYFEVQRRERGLPFGSLTYVMCNACALDYPGGEPEELILQMLVTRAGRFGQQWQDAVRAMLGWCA